MNTYELKRVVEAVLFVSDKPLTVKQIWQKLFVHPGLEEEQEGTEPQILEPEMSGSEVSKDDIYRVLCELESDYADRGCQLKAVASGYRFQVNEDLAMWLQRWKAEKPPRYSRAVLETLAIIAYKQPITRAEIEDIRGVAVSSHIIKGLLEREWVRVVGHKEVPGRPALLATTKAFLDYFNVSSLDQLPTLAEVKELGQMKKGLDEESDSPTVQHPGTEDQRIHSSDQDQTKPLGAQAEQKDLPLHETLDSQEDFEDLHLSSEPSPDAEERKLDIDSVDDAAAKANRATQRLSSSEDKGKQKTPLPNIETLTGSSVFDQPAEQDIFVSEDSDCAST